jgi:hypothetical protein
VSKYMQQFAANAPWLATGSGKKFKLYPLRFVLSLHSQRHFHGLTNGKLAALYQWLFAKGDTRIFDSIYGSGVIGTRGEDLKVSLPFSAQDMEQRLARVLTDHIIDGRIDQSLIITQPWEDAFYPKLSDWCAKASEDNPTLVKQWNPCHSHARLLYGVSLHIFAGKWAVWLNYGCEGSVWHIRLVRGVSFPDDYPPTVAFPHEATNAEFDELLVAWMKENVTLRPKKERARR